MSCKSDGETMAYLMQVYDLLVLFGLNGSLFQNACLSVSARCHLQTWIEKNNRIFTNITLFRGLRSICTNTIFRIDLVLALK